MSPEEAQQRNEQAARYVTAALALENARSATLGDGYEALSAEFVRQATRMESGNVEQKTEPSNPADGLPIDAAPAPIAAAPSPIAEPVSSAEVAEEVADAQAAATEISSSSEEEKCSLSTDASAKRVDDDDEELDSILCPFPLPDRVGARKGAQ